MSCEQNRKASILRFLAWFVFANLAGIGGLWTTLATARGQEPSSTKADDSKATGSDKKAKQAFLRIDNDKEGEPRAFQVAIAHYEIQSGTYQGSKIDLIGAVHIGSKEYYRDLNDRFKSYDALLYELVAESTAKPVAGKARDGFNPIGSMQTGMRDVLKLSFQLEEIDYHASNFVHADMSPSEFGSDMAKRNDGFVSMFARIMGAGFAAQANPKQNESQADMMTAMMSRNTVKLRRAMAKQFDSMDNQMAAIADKSGKSTLLTERNAKAFSVMERELTDGHRHLGIFYGAGHLSDMHTRLVRDFDAKQTSIEWLDAWDLRESANK